MAKGGREGRTRWAFLKDLPPGLLDGSVSEHKRPPQQKDERESPSAGRCVEQLSEAAHEQQQRQQRQQQQQQQREQQPIEAGASGLVEVADADSRSSRANTAASTTATTTTTTSNNEAENTGEAPLLPDAPSAPASAHAAHAQPPPSSLSHAAATAERAPVSEPPATKNTKTITTGEVSDDEAVSPMILSPALRDLLEVKTSNPGAQQPSPAVAGGGGDGGRDGGSGSTTTGPPEVADDDDSSAGLGVFSKRAMRTGDVVLEEGALLKVSRGAVDPATWEAVARVASSVADPRVSAMDLLQAVVFDSAPASVQARVLSLVSYRSWCAGDAWMRTLTD